MKLDNISPITFKSGCDMHAHRGNWWVKLSENQVGNFSGVVRNSANEPYVFRNLTGDLIEIANRAITNQEDKIDKVIISNLDCMVRNHPETSQSSLFPNGYAFLKNEYDGNIELLKNAANSNEFFYATGQPGYGDAKILKKVLDESQGKFVGIKLHPQQLSIPANDKVYEPYMQLAREKKLPCLFHSELNIDWSVPEGKVIESRKLWKPSDPRYILELAQKYPDVPVILAHTGSGGAPAHKKTIDVMLKALDQNKANLYADISWVDFNGGIPSDNPQSVLRLIKECKKRGQLHRILYGTDIPVGEYSIEGAAQHGLSPSQIYKMTVEKLKSAIRNDKDLKDDAENIIDRIFRKNAEELFFEKKWLNNDSSKKILSKTRLGIALGVGFLALGSLFAYSKTKDTNENMNIISVNENSYEQGKFC